jgi:hypothetical protein
MLPDAAAQSCYRRTMSGFPDGLHSSQPWLDRGQVMMRTLVSPEHEVARFVVLSALGLALLVAMFTGAFESNDLPGAASPVAAGTAKSVPAPAPAATGAGAVSPPGASSAAASSPATADKVGLLLAHTPSGRQRNRARVTVQVSVRNSGTRPMFAGAHSAAVLKIAGAHAVSADDRALGRQGALDMTRPLPVGQARHGVLTFETAGAQTKAVLAAGAELSVSGQPGPVQAHIQIPAGLTTP